MIFIPCVVINAICLVRNLMYRNYSLAIVSGIGVAISIVGLYSTI